MFHSHDTVLAIFWGDVKKGPAILVLLASQPAAVRTEIWQAIAAERVFGVENGRIAIPSQAICVVGQRQ